ncbi:terpene cyclase/mutase family protein [Lentisphaera marina]|uniref:prenyltransferase/squalene oxidase repeat-containing protein n=1 Tax=Lentisphaera marina TaxID=1111041 RepID=UPI002364FF36|nr:prenyltransferase/squalene oxidase repeat-containing protein [Lentisphaera marina]MDD7986035.1 terpene cyclase/mutase family protein [Lentisphaera marina]
MKNKLVCFLLLFSCFSLSLTARETTVPISAELSKSLNKGLKFLAASQQDDGSWNGNHGRNVGETSLCLMAFMSMGNLPGEGEYGHVIGKGVNWVVDQAKPNGLIQYSNQEKQAAVMYGHALATLMLSEAWGQSRNEKIGKVLRNAVKLILEVQGKKGGWGYKSVPEDGDTSVMVMQIIALKSAQDAGIYVPQKTIQKALSLIKTRFNETQKMYGYSSTKISKNNYGSSAAGTCIMFICGENEKKYTSDTVGALLKIMKNDPKKQKVGHIPYFLYYASVASYFEGGNSYREWAKMLEKYLIREQKSKGEWGSYYQTAFCILGASLPYQYIPVYQK